MTPREKSRRRENYCSNPLIAEQKPQHDSIVSSSSCYSKISLLSGPPPRGQTVHIAVATVWITMKPFHTLMHRLPTLRWKTSINELTTLTRFACLINFDKKLYEPPLRGNPLTIDPNSQISHHSFSLILGLENTRYYAQSFVITRAKTA